jgi:hypothetical protein
VRSSPLHFSDNRHETQSESFQRDNVHVYVHCLLGLRQGISVRLGEHEDGRFA